VTPIAAGLVRRTATARLVRDHQPLEMRERLSGLSATVVQHERVEALVAEHTLDEAIGARHVQEDPQRREVPEQMRMPFEA
jgi:hypothetical protein